MRVLVTGATGFLGAHLVRRLLADGAHSSVSAAPEFRGDRPAVLHGDRPVRRRY